MVASDSGEKVVKFENSDSIYMRKNESFFFGPSGEKEASLGSVVS